MWNNLKRNKGGLTGVIIIALVTLVAIGAGLLSPHNPNAQDITKRLIGPCWTEKGSFEHILGTDNMGRDILSRLLFGSRVSCWWAFWALWPAGSSV